jgi:hypothetical protein
MYEYALAGWMDMHFFSVPPPDGLTENQRLAIMWGSRKNITEK